jgi:hypothetical protein
MFQEFRRAQTYLDILYDFLDISRYIKKKSCGGNAKRNLEEMQEVIFAKIFGCRATKKNKSWEGRRWKARRMKYNKH